MARAISQPDSRQLVSLSGRLSVGLASFLDAEWFRENASRKNKREEKRKIRTTFHHLVTVDPPAPHEPHSACHNIQWKPRWKHNSQLSRWPIVVKGAESDAISHTNVMSREVALVRADPAANEMTPLIEQPSGEPLEYRTRNLSLGTVQGAQTISTSFWMSYRIIIK